jgi:arylsulfatase A-like enzyme
MPGQCAIRPSVRLSDCSSPSEGLSDCSREIRGAIAAGQGFFLSDYGWHDKKFKSETSIRKPFLASWPRVPAPGNTQSAMALNIDFAPTFMEASSLAPTAEMQRRAAPRQSKKPESASSRLLRPAQEDDARHSGRLMHHY